MSTYLDFFKEICSIPHGSGNTAQISAYCEDFAKKRGLRCIREDCGNVIIFKDGSAGSAADPVILQGHLDMVCVARPQREIDFLTQGLTLREEGDFLFADGTSLGGDDGIAVAYALAILDSDTLVHPPLEVVFTIDEETGMDGARALDLSPLQGKMLINVDSEEEGTLLTSCAGGLRADLSWRGERSAAQDAALQVTLSGLLGGHSGTEIDKHRQNAALLLSQVLRDSGVTRLVSIDAGSADNAIPSSGRAVVLGDAVLSERIKAAFDALRSTFVSEEQRAVLTVAPTMAADAFNERTTAQVLELLTTMPNGVVSMSEDVDGLVQTSLNLGVLRTKGETVQTSHALRSSVGAEKTALTERLAAHAAAFGAEFSSHGAYPAWEYQKESRLRDAFRAAYREQYGEEMQITAIHAGLECGIFCGKKPGLDCVSMGPNIYDIHSFDERLSLSSAARTFRLLCGVLERLA